MNCQTDFLLYKTKETGLTDKDFMVVETTKIAGRVLCVKSDDALYRNYEKG